MSDDGVLEKTNRINMLFDFYGDLLTEKQRTFMACYFHDDYTLGEIAAEFEISRQAVYEHIKRAEHVLEDYESKLALLANYEQRMKCLDDMERILERVSGEGRDDLTDILQRIREIDG
jgi:predicted DNA-binding protein YlxM (UPF0122 family)